MQQKINKYSKQIFLAVLIIAILVRVVLVCSIPSGMHEDEAGLAYDAYCIANYGVDRYLNHLPVYFTNFGGGQSALYVYLTAFLIKIFGLNLFVVRLPSIIFSVLAIIFSYLTVKKLKNTNTALLFLFFIAICPWHIMQSRWALDCNLLSSLIAIDLFLLVTSSKSWHYLFTGILLGITLYTYALSYIMLPVFTLCIIIYLLLTKKASFKNLLIMVIPTLVLAFPLVFVQIVNMFGLEKIDLGFITIPSLFSYRVSEFGIKNVLPNLNITTTNNVFKLLFFFDHNEFNALKEFGTMYYISIPFIICGFTLSAKKFIKDITSKSFTIDSIFFIQFVSIFICTLFFADLQLYKLNALFIPCLYFLSLAIVKLISFSKAFLPIVVIIYLLNFGLFVGFYYTNMNSKQGIAFNTDLISTINYINSNEEFASKSVHIESDGTQQYIYVLLANKTSPYEFYKTKKIITLGYNTCEVIGFDKYTFLYYGEIDSNKIYVVEKNNLLRQSLSNELIEELENANFNKQEYNGFYIYSKE